MVETLKVRIPPRKRVATPVLEARPFVKWAGGKGQLLPYLQPYVPRSFRRYVEPFLGGGAVFFHLRPGKALLGDSTPELMEAYRVVKEEVEALMAALDRHAPHVLDSEYYYQLRAEHPTSVVERAARFIYLNKTCYNGLYRVNRQGQFNVPFGRYKRPPSLYDAKNLRAVSELLSEAELRCVDFTETMAAAGPGDLVYLDPPYDPLSATANFTGYTRASFGREEQERLAVAVRAAAARGALVLLNNSDTPLVRALYKDFRIAKVPALRAINSDPTKRKGAVELMITNYRKPGRSPTGRVLIKRRAAP